MSRVSASCQSGSSAWNGARRASHDSVFCATMEDPKSSAAPSAADQAPIKRRCSECMFEPQERNEAFAAERQIEAADERAVAVEAEPDAVRDFHVIEGEAAAVRRHLARVDEERAVQRPPRFPAVFG